MEKKSKVISKDKSTNKKPVEQPKKEQTKKEQPKKTTTTTTTTTTAVTKKPETKKNDKKVTTTTTTTKNTNTNTNTKTTAAVSKKPEITKKNEKKVTVETKKPNSQKRKKIESSEDEESSGSEEEEDLGFVPDSSEDEDEDSDFDEIQADFDLVPCVDKDYHSIKNMINRLIPYNDSSKFNGGELTDLIIAQAEKKKFGRSINIDGNEDPFGFLSILNYDQVRKAETIQGYLDYINEKLDTPEDSYIDSKCGEKSMKSLLAKLTSPSTAKSSPLGLIFCERFINIPNELIPSLYQFMQFDVELMQEKNNDKNYDFKNYLILSSYGITAKGNDDEQPPPPPTKIQQQDDSSEEEDEQPTKKSKSNKGVINKKKEKKQTPPPPPPQQQPAQEEEIEEGIVMYQKCEDKYFREHAIAWSTFDIPYQYGNGPKWTLFGHLNRKGLIMIVPATKYQQFLSDLKEKAIFD